jgi:ERCC4-type nuclease
MPSHFQFTSAYNLITSHSGNITKLSQLTKYCNGRGSHKIGSNVFNYITKIMNKEIDVVCPMPTDAQVKKALEKKPSSSSSSSSPSSSQQSNNIHNSSLINNSYDNTTTYTPLPGEYVPRKRSGAYAILLTLYDNGTSRKMTKHQIIPKAQSLCDEDLKIPGRQGYTAWKGIDTLTAKGLAERDARSRDFRGQGGFGKAADLFWITDKGKQLAERLLGRSAAAAAPSSLPSSSSRVPAINLNSSSAAWEGGFGDFGLFGDYGDDEVDHAEYGGGASTTGTATTASSAASPQPFVSFSSAGQALGGTSVSKKRNVSAREMAAEAAAQRSAAASAKKPRKSLTATSSSSAKKPAEVLVIDDDADDDADDEDVIDLCESQQSSSPPQDDVVDLSESQQTLEFDAEEGEEEIDLTFDDSQKDEDEEDLDIEWACDVCTFLNPSRALVCDACGKKRDSTTCTSSIKSNSPRTPLPQRRICCIIDDRERHKNNDPNSIYNNTRKALNEASEKGNLLLSAARHNLALGDYQWAADTRQDDDFEDDEMGEAAVLQYVVERKTIGDLVGRSRQGDHLSQLRRLNECGAAHAFLLIEGDETMATGHSSWRKHNDPDFADDAGVESVVDVHSLVADIILKASATNVRLLETAGPAETRRLLAAMTNLVALEDEETRKEGGSGEEEINITDFGKRCRSDAKRLKPFLLDVPPRIGQAVRDDIARSVGGLTIPLPVSKQETAFGKLYDMSYNEEEVSLLAVSGRTLVDAMLRDYSGPAPASFGEAGVGEGAQDAAAKFAERLPKKVGGGRRRLVLMVEKLPEECTRRKNSAHRLVQQQGEAGLTGSDVLANGGGLLTVVELFLAALVIREDVIVKKTGSGKESIGFALVLKDKCGGGGGRRREGATTTTTTTTVAATAAADRTAMEIAELQRSVFLKQKRENEAAARNKLY